MSSHERDSDLVVEKFRGGCALLNEIQTIHMNVGRSLARVCMCLRGPCNLNLQMKRRVRLLQLKFQIRKFLRKTRTVL